MACSSRTSIRSTTSSRLVPSSIGPSWAAATFTQRAMASSSGARTLPPRATLARGSMHTLMILDPGHFHAALTLRERHPQVSDEVVVYVPDGPGDEGGRPAAEFLDLLTAFNRRAQRPAQWRVVVRARPGPPARPLPPRPGDAGLLAAE